LDGDADSRDTTALAYELGQFRRTYGITGDTLLWIRPNGAVVPARWLLP
jgi:hypothetical protein